jgi:hypothetical protein
MTKNFIVLPVTNQNALVTTLDFDYRMTQLVVLIIFFGAAITTVFYHLNL